MAPLTFADTHNMVAFLSKSDASNGFDQIMDFLNAHTIKYALVVNPTIYVVVSEDIIRRDLQLDDADGVECLPNDEIFKELARMRYEKPPPKLTFYKACSIASAVIYLATARKFNFSKYVFDSMVRNVDSSSKFLIYTSLALTQKVFANMRRVRKGFSGVETPLFDSMLVQPQPQAEEGVEIPIAPASPSTTTEEESKEARKEKKVKVLRVKKAEKGGGKIAAIDADKGITLVDVETDEELVNAAESAEPTVFDDEDVIMTMAQILIKLKAEKAKLLDEQIAQKLHDEEIIRVGGIIEAYQNFEDMLKGFDREDLVALWNLVKEKFSSAVPNEDKEKALWVELKSDCGVQHVSSTKGHDIFMLTEKDYPLSNAVMILMQSGKLQFEEDNEMARDLVIKIFMEANKPRSRSLDTSS
uniref:Synaptobrevin, longin-like domain protein n=1 Tax=Tanacetum cinerariifolium TaxID=118510 RepID=A0A6L2P2P2_TANCI|nr:hypothetical protein [Tanacetum cinerariifolium]